MKQTFNRRSLRKRLGAELYTVDDIERATQYYIRPSCQNIDPAYNQEIVHNSASRNDLFSAIDQLLYSSSSSEVKYIVLLADSGMGKTSFLLNYYVQFLRRFRKPFALQIIPLGSKNANEHIQALERKSESVLFLDALDEDPRAIEDHGQRIRALCEMTSGFRRVLMTCRTQFFPQAEEEPQRSGVIKLGAIGPDEEGEYLFHKLYLAPFDDRQVAEYLRRRYPSGQQDERWRAQALVEKIPQLTARPMLLAHLDDLLDADYEYAYSFQLYEKMVEAWLKREEGRVPGLKRREPLRKFCEMLAIELFRRRQEQGAERLPYEEIEPLARQFHIELSAWQLSGRSLLNRDAENNFKFAHRSIMEYLFVKKFIELPIEARPQLKWTAQMKRFMVEMIYQHWSIRKTIDWDLHHMDLSALANSQVKPFFQFEKTGRALKYEDVTSMVKQLNFFDAEKNPSGRGIFHFYEKIKSHESVVVDSASGLIWQKEESEKAMLFSETEKFIQKLNSNHYAGFSDWRLPTLQEAMSIMKYGEKTPVYLSPNFKISGGIIWTADVQKTKYFEHSVEVENSIKTQSWVVDFSIGCCKLSDASVAYSILVEAFFVRAVRTFKMQVNYCENG